MQQKHYQLFIIVDFFLGGWSPDMHFKERFFLNIFWMVTFNELNVDLGFPVIFVRQIKVQEPEVVITLFLGEDVQVVSIRNKRT